MISLLRNNNDQPLHEVMIHMLMLTQIQILMILKLQNARMITTIGSVSTLLTTRGSTSARFKACVHCCDRLCSALGPALNPQLPIGDLSSSVPSIWH